MSNNNDKTNHYIETPWDIIESYFREDNLKRLVRHQIESYNDFIEYQLPKTIEMFNPVEVKSPHDYDPVSKKYALEISIQFENFKIYRPQINENNGAVKLMFPQEARLRNFTYSAASTIDIHIQYITRTGENLEQSQIAHSIIPQIHIGKIPIMLKSSICVLTQYKHFTPEQTDECEFDAGGHFVINGSDKIILCQERAAENRVYCFNVHKNIPKYTWKAEIKSVPDYKCISLKHVCLYILTKNNGFGNAIVVEIPRVKCPIPLFVVFRALGIISDKSICNYISREQEMHQSLEASIIESAHIQTREDAIRCIMGHIMFTPMNMDRETALEKKHEFVEDVMTRDLFPHCKTAEQKIYFLGYMSNQILSAHLGYREEDDRDIYMNKRVDAAGALLNNLYRTHFNKLVKDMEKQIVREINGGSWKSKSDVTSLINMTNIYKIVKTSTIEYGLKRALSTGDFGVKQNNTNKVGVAQVFNRLNYVSGLSHARRISASSDSKRKLIPPRKITPTSWGFICPVETPEGHSVGVVKNLACLAHITIYSDSSPLYDIISPKIFPFAYSGSPETLSKVFINGTWIGVTDDPIKLSKFIRERKYKGIINIYTSIVYDYVRMELRVCNDSGRLTRPLLRVVDRSILITPEITRQIVEKKLSWDDLVMGWNDHDSVIEYVDPEEQAYAVIATYPEDLQSPDKRLIQYTHCEIHPSTIFGVLGSCIPFPEHNQSPRNTYQSAQHKQAIAIYATNYHSRMDKTSYILNYPMRPLVETRIMDMIQLYKIPSGFQAVVAIMSYTGYNQEDSILINQGSIDRGFALATIYHTEKDEDKQKLNGDKEIRRRPDPSVTKGIKVGGNYDKVNAQGLVPENTFIENKDIIISKVVPIKENRNDPNKIIKFQDHSRTFKTSEESYIDKNYVSRNGEGYNFAKVRVRSLRKPVVGDKFSSRHGQKGTIGRIIAEKDMPFTSSGLRPDIIINPHAIPSRMTIGQLKETIMGKVLIELGLFGDGTAFTDFRLENICSLMTKCGYEAHGNELMYDGESGNQIECSVFIGPVFYQRLKHMVIDKTHSRSVGLVVNLTRQPMEGRARDGGLRFGEMERDCMISHGAARFTRERMYDASDKYVVYICRKCGVIAAFNHTMHIHICKTCDNRTDFARVEIPYACKLLFQELTMMSVTPRLITE